MNINVNYESESISDLQQKLLRRLLNAILVSSAFLLWYAINHEPFSIQLVIYWFALLGGSWLCRSQIQTAQAILPKAFVFLVIVAYSSALLIWQTLWLPFVAVLVILMVAMLWWPGAVIVSLITFGSYLALNFATNTTYPLIALGAFLIFGTTVVLIIVETFYTILLWHSAMYEQINTLLEETRERRAELRRTVDKLETAYATQSRIQKQLVYARRQAEESQRQKEQFTANVSHELRTPLNIILGFSEVMHLSPEVYGTFQWPPMLRRDVGQVYRSSRHLLEMIDDILDLSHFGLSSFGLRLEDISTHDLLSETVDIAQHIFRDVSVQFEHHIQDSLPDLRIDRTRMRQVLLNLLNNARRFTEQGTVTLSAYSENEQLIITVKDTGRGIAEEDLPHVFDEYFQVNYSLSRKHGGAGLGLAISKRFVEAHKGMITVESEVGRGTEFKISLPIQANMTRKTAQQLAQSNQNTSERIPTLVFLNQDPSAQRFIEQHLPDHMLISITDMDELRTAILENHPEAIVINTASNYTEIQPDMLKDVKVPILRCKFPNQFIWSTNLPVDFAIRKPLTRQHVELVLSKYPNSKQILVVDDDRGFVQLLQRMIHANDSSYQITSAYTGEDAIHLINDQDFDLVFLDRIMPTMRGDQVLQHLNERVDRDKLPQFVMLTADTVPEAETDSNFKDVRLSFPHLTYHIHLQILLNKLFANPSNNLHLS